MNANDRSILSVTMFGHGMVHAYELAIPIFIPIWMSEFGVGAAAMGLAVSIGYAMYGIGAVPGGVATDRFGSKRLMVFCLLGMGSSFILLGVTGDIIGVTAVLLMWGIAASLYHPAGLRLISTGVESRGTAFGYHGIAGNVGIATGPLIAVVLLMLFDWEVVVIVMAVPALLGAVFTAVTSIDELAAISADQHTRVANGGSTSLPAVLTSSRAIFTGGFLIVFPMVILEGFYYRGVLTFLPDVLGSYESLAPVTAGSHTLDPAQYVFVGILVIGMGGQFVGGKLSDRVRPERAAVWAFALLAVISLLFVPAASAGIFPLLLVSALLGFVLFGEQPLLQAVVADYSATDVRGLSYGYMFLGVFGVGALGATFSGAMLAYTTQQALFLLLGVVPVIAGLLALRLVIRGKPTTR